MHYINVSDPRQEKTLCKRQNVVPRGSMCMSIYRNRWSEYNRAYGTKLIGAYCISAL